MVPKPSAFEHTQPLAQALSGIQTWYLVNNGLRFCSLATHTIVLLALCQTIPNPLGVIIINGTAKVSAYRWMGYPIFGIRVWNWFSVSVSPRKMDFPTYNCGCLKQVRHPREMKRRLHFDHPPPDVDLRSGPYLKQGPWSKRNPLYIMGFIALK